ncbi:MAG: aminotransferase class III-fold pyridoxal phosphate-dependent enzyme [Desulfobacula sp.]|nr:aminotransferase class III-fold pyridoxal phosphate-dependent enzyme [Desulfobacula sp.]
MKMTTEEAFVKVLQIHGIEHAFGIIGSAMMPISDLFPKAGIRFWDCGHEGNAGMMADGFTRASGKISMMVAQNGPGITNFVTPVKTAYWNHTPLLLVTPQAANMTMGQGGFQEVPQMTIFEDMVAYQEEVLHPSRIAEVLNRVIMQAKRASAPAQINIPRDFWIQVVDIELPSIVTFERPAGGEAAIARAAALPSNARFPVILNGGGVVIGGAIQKSMVLAERLDAPVCCVWSVIVGYGRDSIAEAVCDQMKKMPYFAGIFGNIPAIKFAQKFLEKLPRLDKVFFSNSGSEANEKAFKIIRQASRINAMRKGKYKIMYRDRDYHGTTIGAMSATDQAQRIQDFGPFVEGFVEFPHCACYRCPYDKTYGKCNIECARKIEDIILQEGADTIGGMIVEPITAGGGILKPVKKYYPILQEICKKYDIWLIMDEVVCGFGRTGKFWGHDHYDIDPDIITMAKGLASSYEALSATVVKQKVYDVFLNDPTDPDTRLDYFRDISTYGGCTAPMVAALESTRIIEDENLIENSRVVGEYLFKKLNELKKYDCVGDIRGQGLFCGIEYVNNKATKDPITEEQMTALMDNVIGEGVIVGRTNFSFHGLNNIMNFAPSLIITKKQVDTIVTAVTNAIEKTFKF